MSQLPFLRPAERMPVVTRIWRPQNGVDMELGGLGVRQEDARVVVEFDHHDGALDAVVEWIDGSVATDPGEVRRGEVGLDLLDPRRAGLRGEVEQVLCAYREDEGSLRRGHVGDEDALVGDGAVVAEGAAEVSLVVLVPAVGWHRWVVHLLINLRFSLQVRWEVLHQV